MKNLPLMLSAWLLLFSFTACEDDLNTQPTDDDITDLDSFFTSASGYRAFLAGIYANMAQPGQTGAFDSNISGIDGGSSTFTRTIWYLQTLTTDEAVWTYENDAGVADVQRLRYNDNNEFVLGAFARMAQTIAYTNEYVRRADGLTEDDIEGITAYRAEARFIRALMYYYFLDLYGKAPFVTENDPAGSVSFKPPQADRQQLFDYIESELNAILPDLINAGANEYGRADKGAAWMLLAKLYLNAEVYIGQNRYDDVVTNCNNIINSGAYMLNPTYGNNFTADNDASNELIFTILADGTNVQNYGATTVMVNGSVGSLEGNGVTLVGQPGWGGALRLRSQAAQIITSANAGTRNTVPTLDASRTIQVLNPLNPDTGYIVTKFKNITSSGDLGSNEGGNDFVDTDYPLFRYADVLLMYAEAAWRGATNATEAQGITYINMLRNRASAPTVSSLSENLILNERLMELYWEGHRRQDLKRFNQFTGANYIWDWKGDVASGAAISDHLAWFPIHTNSLLVNPNLTQNDGY